MSLVDIEKMPTAENSAIHLHPTDNVAVLRVPVSPGAELRVGGVTVITKDSIPAGHKVCLKTIPAGDRILRYGQVIGRSKVTIEPGQHIHTHNVLFEEQTFNYEFPPAEVPYP
ncbi:MAG: UxaA family hydrolase, partial [bacterium]